MECKIFPENARIIDQILRSTTVKTVAVSTVANITIQTKFENSNLYTNIVLQREFFVELQVKEKTVVEFQKIKFYMHEMEFLNIKISNYFVEFYWNFKTHTHTKTLCIGKTTLKSINFEYQECFNIDASLLKEVIKQLLSNEIAFNFEDKIKFYNVEAPSGVSIEVENYTKMHKICFSVLRRSLKAVSEGPFDTFEFMLDCKERRLSICTGHDCLSVIHILAVYIEQG